MSVPLNISCDKAGVSVQSVETDNRDGDKHDQADYEKCVESDEEEVEEWMPSAIWMGCSDNSLREDIVDDE